MSHPQPPPPTNKHGLTIRDNESETWDLTVRFSASLPDLQVSLPVSEHASTSTLKQRIREALPSNLARHRIRLIHAGKALDDTTALTKSLKRPASKPPSRVATPGPLDGPDTEISKGKAKATTPRIYIHCSIGDVVLSDEELGREAAQAQTQTDETTTASVVASVTTAPAARGFDRLLSAGFTGSEVANLRLQFLNIQAHTHTPDTMPSPTTLRAMEDQWLDNSGGSVGVGGDGEGGGFEADHDSGHLDDMFWGTMMGFFWPVGCLMWGTREEGVFSPRRKIAVVIGVLLNLGLGFVKYGG